MAFTIFFSWQDDFADCRNFIENSLKKAIRQIATDATVEEPVREDLAFDKDTMGVPGSPPIFETILDKISRAAVFVPDLTFVGKRADGRLAPNPNVLIEYGWALKSLGYNQIVPVMNTAYGEPSNLPFDLAHLRRPLQYNLPEQADEETRKRVRTELSADLARALRDIFQSDEFRATLPKPPEPPPFPEMEPLSGRARFRLPGQSLGINTNSLSAMMGQQTMETQLLNGPALWLRVMPLTGVGQNWLISEVKQLVLKICLLPLIDAGPGSIGVLRNEDGCGAYPIVGEPTEADAVVWVFTSGEIWAINTRFSRQEGIFTLDESMFVRSLAQCCDFLEGEGVLPPYRWIVGMERFKGRYLVQENSYVRRGPCMHDRIEDKGVFQKGDNPSDCLRPFFERVFDSFGIVRPDSFRIRT